jgi:putative tryptophan/tyrosine transport system substrate-binding protein
MSMKRRDFITLLGGAAAWPVAARAQQPAIPVVGYINPGSLAIATEGGQALRAFQQGLAEAGYAEGRNVAIEYRWADEIYDRLPALFDDLVRRQVSVIVVTGGALPLVLEKAAGASIPFVFTAGVDPVRAGFVASLNRPGGNITGASFFSSELGPKRLELLRQLVPKASSLAVLLNPLNPNFEPATKLLSSAADALGIALNVLRVHTDQDIDMAFGAMLDQHVNGFLIGPDSFIFSRNAQIAALALRHGLPAIYQWREFAAAGGLISYGPNQTEPYRQAGIYAGRILKGQKPADLPVVQSTKIEMVINLRTAKALGLTVPLALLTRADEVIE